MSDKLAESLRRVNNDVIAITSDFIAKAAYEIQAGRVRPEQVKALLSMMEQGLAKLLGDAAQEPLGQLACGAIATVTRHVSVTFDVALPLLIPQKIDIPSPEVDVSGVDISDVLSKMKS